MTRVNNATDQLNQAKGAKKNHEAEAARKDSDEANRWPEQIWRDQIKATSLGVRPET